MGVASLLPVDVDLLLTRGTDVRLRATLANRVTGAAYDITNDTITLTVRDGYTGAVFLTKSNAPGEHLDPEAGQTRFHLTKAELADTANADETIDRRYEIRRILADGDEVVFFRGIFRLTPTPAPV